MRGSDSTKDDLVSLSDFVWQRTSGRLRGLDDGEYLWEPVPGCWTIRDGGDGRHYPDGVQPAPQPPPFTTIAWRLAHLTACYGADRNGRFLHVTLEPAVLSSDGSRAATATEALELLERAHARWRAHLTAVPADAMAERLGPVAGPFAEGTISGFVLHMVDEFVHHGAELALLRDLYAATAAGTALTTGDELVDRLIKDPAALESIAGEPQAKSDHPDAVTQAASAGRWDLVMALARLGFPLGRPGERTALHLAAGAGALPAVRVLVEHGADTDACDPVFGATALGWAQYFGAAHVEAYLAGSDASPTRPPPTR